MPFKNGPEGMSTQIVIECSATQPTKKDAIFLQTTIRAIKILIWASYAVERVCSQPESGSLPFAQISLTFPEWPHTL